MTVLSTIRSTDHYQSGESSVININFESGIFGPLAETGDCEEPDHAGGRRLAFDSNNSLRPKSVSAESNRPSSREKPVKIRYLKTSLVERTFGDKDSHSDAEFQSKKTVTFLEEPKIIEYQRDPLEDRQRHCDPASKRPPQKQPSPNPSEALASRRQLQQAQPSLPPPSHTDKENQDSNQPHSSDRKQKRILNLKDLQLNPKNYSSKRVDSSSQRLVLREADLHHPDRAAAAIDKLSKSKRCELSQQDLQTQLPLSSDPRTASQKLPDAASQHPPAGKDSVNSSLQRIFQDNYLRAAEDTDRWPAPPRPVRLEDSLSLSQQRQARPVPVPSRSSELLFQRSLSSNDLGRAKPTPLPDSLACRLRRANRSGLEESASCRSLVSKSTNLPRRAQLEQGKAIADSLVTPASVLAKSIEQARANFRELPFRSNSIVSSKLGFLHAVGALAERQNSHKLIPAGLRDRGGSVFSELINLKFKMNETYSKIRSLKSASRQDRHERLD